VDLLSAIVLGTVQGLTEFLPVSSTAHLLIVARWLRFEDPGGVFTVTIQFGSILAVIWLYRAKLLRIVRDLPRDPAARRFVAMLLVAFLPAVFAGFFLEPFIKTILYASRLVIPVAFIVGGVVMLVVERYRPTPVVDTADRTPLPRAAAIGVAQTVAMIPGVSRSGATIVGGLLAGLERSAAAEFSFFLAMPTMGAAFAKDLWDVRHQLSSDRGAEIAVGFVMAFLASLLVVKPFLRFVSRSGFAPFAWYRILAGLALLVALALGVG
jgi:undecaprenyl-diphosphatase